MLISVKKKNIGGEREREYWGGCMIEGSQGRFC